MLPSSIWMHSADLHIIPQESVLSEGAVLGRPRGLAWCTAGARSVCSETKSESEASVLWLPVNLSPAEADCISLFPKGNTKTKPNQTKQTQESGTSEISYRILDTFSSCWDSTTPFPYARSGVAKSSCLKYPNVHLQGGETIVSVAVQFRLALYNVLLYFSSYMRCTHFYRESKESFNWDISA